MAFLRNGTFLRLIGLDGYGVKAALEVEIAPVTIDPTTLTDVATLAAATYGVGKPSIMPYVGYEFVIGQDEGASPTGGAGDARNKWVTYFNGGAPQPDQVGIPGRDTGDANLIQSGTTNQINVTDTAWTTWLAALAASPLLAPYNGAAEPFINGLATTAPRVRPRERVREVPTPITTGGTRLKLWGIDVRKKLAATEFFIKSIVLPTGLVTAINALGAATYGSIVGTHIRPSFMEYVGFEVIVSADSGFGGTVGFGDSRDKWSMVAEPVTGGDLRWVIPGRNTAVSGLILPGTRTLANMGFAAWVAWVAAMGAATLLAPQKSDGTLSSIIGGRSTVRTTVQPRESVS